MNKATITNGAIREIQLRLFGLKLRKKSEFETTETELRAIASPANSGFNTKPQTAKTRAAIGMPITL